jgi:hypothetical protein
MDCLGDCFDPPPDKIASMPPPPLPSYLLPRSAIVALSGNDSQPCFAAFMCDPTPHPKEQSGIELIELTKNGEKNISLEYYFKKGKGFGKKLKTSFTILSQIPMMGLKLINTRLSHL